MADPFDIIFTPEFQARFNEKFERGGPDECWNWTAGISAGTGYGFVSVNRRKVGSHRVAWMAANEMVVLAGLVVRHRCDNRRCVNPRHLEIGTKADNILDAVERGRISGISVTNSAKTHCPRGHLLDGFQSLEKRRGFRYCRTCSNERSKLAKRAAREAQGSVPRPSRRS